VVHVAWALARRRARVRARHMTDNARGSGGARQPDGNHDRTYQPDGERQRACRHHAMGAPFLPAVHA
jgi:hypothetical protein